MEELDTKAKILIGAEELFAKYGVRSVSMDDIARHLGVSKKTLYVYFTEKDEIVASVTHNYMQSEVASFNEIKSVAKNAVDELVKISDCIKKNMQDMNPSLLFDLHKYHPKAWKIWIDFKHQFIRSSVERNLSQGIEEGYFRSDINTEILSGLRILCVEAAFDEQLFPKGKYKLVDVQSEIFDHFVFGLCTDKGRKLYLKYKEKQHQPSTN